MAKLRLQDCFLSYSEFIESGVRTIIDFENPRDWLGIIIHFYLASFLALILPSIFLKSEDEEDMYFSESCYMTTYETTYEWSSGCYVVIFWGLDRFRLYTYWY